MQKYDYETHWKIADYIKWKQHLFIILANMGDIYLNVSI